MASTVIEIVKNNPELLSKLLGLVGRLFGGKKEKPVNPITKPEGGNPEDDFPDDVIPAPKAAVTISRVRLKLSRVQLSKQRFPNAPNNGLLTPEDCRKIESGESAMNYGSKFWLDLTAFDQNNQEILRDRVVSSGLCYKTKHFCGDAYIIGHGGDVSGPTPGYETNDTDEIGNGDTAWRASLGFLHQMKAHGQGTFTCRGEVNGVASNEFTIKVS